MYRVGLPFWKTAARLGVPIKVRVDVHYDEESSSFWAKSPSLDGLVVAGANLDELREEVISAASELLALQLEDKVAHATTEIRIKDSDICIA
ncbi:hypothetical protein GY14_20730 [Delftia tsuruhatensis]|nr:hypothetical protein GY14_20730 [Delftia tsuruhatensis]